MKFLSVLLLSYLLFAPATHAATAEHEHHLMMRGPEKAKPATTSKPVIAKKAPSKKAIKKPTSAYDKVMGLMHERMMGMTYTGDTDVDFARGMIPHHQGAVDMANILLASSQDKKLRKLARQIITWQNEEIGIMKRWLSARENTPVANDVNERESVKGFKAAMHDMHEAMDIPATGDINVDFSRGMIPHHQGAVDMAWVQIAYGRDPELRKIARDIIRSQPQEICLMQYWLNHHTEPKHKD